MSIVCSDLSLSLLSSEHLWSYADICIKDDDKYIYISYTTFSMIYRGISQESLTSSFHGIYEPLREWYTKRIQVTSGIIPWYYPTAVRRVH